jgi:hypothetical protein
MNDEKRQTTNLLIYIGEFGIRTTSGTIPASIVRRFKEKRGD